jgi:hypothetical protein
MHGCGDGVGDREGDSSAAAPVQAWLGCELADRYCIESVLVDSEGIAIFAATDHLLRRQALVARQRAEDGDGLASMGRAVARIRNAHVVNVYDCGTYQNYDFVVFERVMTTLTSLHDGARLDWEFSQTADAIRSMTGALGDLKESGVDMSHVHPGAIGFASSGDVKVSPWPFEPANQPDIWSDVALASYMLESVRPSVGSEIDPVAETITLRTGTADDTQLYLPDSLRDARYSDAATSQLWMADMPTGGPAGPLSTQTHSSTHSRPMWLIASAAVVVAVMVFVLASGALFSTAPPAAGAHHAPDHTAAVKRLAPVVPGTAGASDLAPATTSPAAVTVVTPTTIPSPATATTTAPSAPTTPTPTTTTVVPPTPTTVVPTPPSTIPPTASSQAPPP